MVVRISKRVLERYIAPGISEFESADIPDMREYDSQSTYWVTNHFLNNMLRGSLKLPAAAYVHNYLRRAEGAFAEYAEAREATYRYLGSDRQSPSLYASALLHWEFFLSQAWQAYALLQKLIQLLVEDPRYKVFQPEDGSIEQRLWLLYNSMKHVESRIASDQLLDGAIMPVWLSNQGIVCTDGH
jgi:hypothetical protein